MVDWAFNIQNQSTCLFWWLTGHFGIQNQSAPPPTPLHLPCHNYSVYLVKNDPLLCRFKILANWSHNLNTWKVQKLFIRGAKTLHAHLWGNPLYQFNYKTTLKQQLKWRKMSCRTKTQICFWLSYVVFVSSVWKNVGDCQTAEERWKMSCRTKTWICFWLSYVVFVSSVWKNVGDCQTAEERWKMSCRTKTWICFWLSYVVFVSSVWKNVGDCQTAEAMACVYVLISVPRHCDTGPGAACKQGEWRPGAGCAEGYAG